MAKPKTAKESQAHMDDIELGKRVIRFSKNG